MMLLEHEIFLQEQSQNFLRKSNMSKNKRKACLLFLWSKTMMMLWENKCRDRKWINQNGVGIQKKKQKLPMPILSTGEMRVLNLPLNSKKIQAQKMIYLILTLNQKYKRSLNHLIFSNLISKRPQLANQNLYLNLMLLTFLLQNLKYLVLSRF